jgi:hypothetical protein
MVMFLEWCRILAFVIRVRMNQNFPITHLVGMDENNIVYNKKSN